MQRSDSPHVVVTNSRDFLVAFVLMFIFFACISLYGAVQYGIIIEKIEWTEQNQLDRLERERLEAVRNKLLISKIEVTNAKRKRLQETQREE